MFPNSIAAFGSKDDRISRDQYAADFQQQTNNLNNMIQMLRCVSYKIATQSIPNAVGTALEFDTDVISIPPTPSIHNAATFPSRFVAVANGYYEAMGQVSFTGLTAGTFVQLFTRVNGVAPTPTGRQAVSAHATATAIQVRMVYRLAYLDYVDFVVRQDNGGAFNTDVQFTFGSLTLLSRL